MTLLSRLIRRAPEPQESYPVDSQVHLSGSAGGCEPGGGDAADEIEKAYKAGYDAGFASSRSAIQDEIGAHVRAFGAMVDDLVSQRKRLVTESEVAVVRLSCEIAQKIVEKVAELKEETVVGIVKNALDHLADKQKLTIRVNPVDLEVLKRHQGEWLAAAGTSGAVEIAEDLRIKRGGCLIEGESGSVEAQIDRQIEVMEKALVEAAK
jgi:flagellar biosynthesis/type III secretory pathway protein FliH